MEGKFDETKVYLGRFILGFASEISTEMGFDFHWISQIQFIMISKLLDQVVAEVVLRLATQPKLPFNASAFGEMLQDLHGDLESNLGQ